METRQGKQFNYSNVMLYKIWEKDKTICMIVNDKEQLSKYMHSAKFEDAPIIYQTYKTEEEKDKLENKILTSMKQIEKYSKEINKEGIKSIKVLYSDGENYNFSSKSEDSIEYVFNKQIEMKRNVNIGDWAKKEPIPIINVNEISQSNQSNKYGKHLKQDKKKVSSNLRRTLAGALAGVFITGGILYGANKLKKNIAEDDVIPEEDPRKSEQTITDTSKFIKDGKEFYNEILSKNSFILTQQQVAEVDFDEKLSLEMVELLNGVYPTAMQYMTEENAKLEMMELQNALMLVISGNLYPDTKAEDMVDIGKYIKDEEAREILNTSMILSRNVINESIGEPMNGKILNEDDWDKVNDFSKKFTNSVDALLHYEYQIMSDPIFLGMPDGIKFITSDIFYQINGVIPQYSFITLEKSEKDEREHDVYYRWFYDHKESKAYFPRPSFNETEEYVYTYYDENNNCKEEVYSRDEMFDMAGDSVLGIGTNPNIHQNGIEMEVDKLHKNSQENLINLRTNSLIK